MIAAVKVWLSSEVDSSTGARSERPALVGWSRKGDDGQQIRVRSECIFRMASLVWAQA
jgi:hypothetical protein